MSHLTITDAKGCPHDFLVEFDEQRGMWRFQGLGFDLWAYPIAGGDDIDDLDAPTACLHAEASRAGDESGCTVLLSIACPPSGDLTEDLFASKCLKELGRFWDLFGELEDAD